MKESIENSILSEQSLARTWDTPEEDEAWSDLQQPSPTANIEELLREIEPHVEWIQFDRSKDSWLIRSWPSDRHIDINDGLDQFMFIGAIYADCQERGWYLFRDKGLVGIRRHKDPASIGPIKSQVKEVNGLVNAILLAYRNALLAQCTCESEDGWHLVDVCPLGGTSKELAGAECAHCSYTVQEGKRTKYKQCRTCTEKYHNGTSKVDEVCPEHPLAEMTDGQCHDCETNERIAWDSGTDKVEVKT